MGIYEQCTETHGQNALNIVQCVAKWVEEEKNTTALVNNTTVSETDLTNWLLILTGALVFFMQAGFAMVCAGAIRKKNVNNTVRFACLFVSMVAIEYSVVRFRFSMLFFNRSN
jgi:magnesium-transporting ATPase (P-type)